MSAAFTGGPYYVSEFTPSTPGNMVQDLADCINASGWKLAQAVPAYATGTITQPTDGTTVTLNGITYTFKITATLSHQVTIGVSAIATAANFESVVNTTSATIVVSFDGVSVLTLSYYQGGASGNGTSVSGWITWTAGGGAVTNQLWGGGYKFRTSLPAAVPCIVYVYDANVTNASDSKNGACVQFMSGDQTIQGMVHLVKASSQTMRYIGSPVQFFLYNKEDLQDRDGAFVCGGSFFTPATPAPVNAWYSFGDYENYIFGNADALRTTLGYSSGLNSSESCFDVNYCGPGHSGAGVTRLTIYSSTDQEFESGSTAQPVQRYGGDPWVSEPFIVSGDSNGSSPLRLRGQLYDALVVCTSFTTGYTGVALATAYPWADGSTRGDGTPRNRLSPDFDNVQQWENITESYAYGGLFVASNGFVTVQKANYVY